MRRTRRFFVAVSLLALCVSCRKRNGASGVPGEAAKASTTPSIKADVVPSATKPKREKCELVTRAEPIHVRSKVEQIAVAITSAGRAQLDVVAKATVMRATLELGAVPQSPALRDTKTIDPVTAPVAMGGELATVGIFTAKVPEPMTPDASDPSSYYVKEAPPFVFEKGNAVLATPIVRDSPGTNGYGSDVGAHVPRRIAVVTAGEARWLAATVGREVVCESPTIPQWDELRCIFRTAGGRGGGGNIPDKIILAKRAPSLRVWTPSGTSIASREILEPQWAEMGGSEPTGIMTPDSIAASTFGETVVLAWRANGGIYALPVGLDGSVKREPDTAEDYKEKGKAIGGGDLGPPTIAPYGDKTIVVWAQRPKAKQPRVIHAVSFDPITRKAGNPTPHLREGALGSVVAPVVIATTPGTIALAWLDTDGKQANVWLGQGATPAEAVQKAVMLGTSPGEGRELALAFANGRFVIAWSSRTASDDSVRLSHVECP